MKGKIFLSGGGDKNQTFDIDEIFLKDIKKILYIPIAWKNEDYNSCLNWFMDMIKSHKHAVIEMCTDLTKKIELENYDAVYIGGGNTFKLLKKLKENKFDKKIIEYYLNGGIIYGGSAGAIIWGFDINISNLGKDSDKNEVNLIDKSGLNFVGGKDIQCHYEQDQLDELKRYSLKIKRDILAIPEESAILIDDKNLKVIGNKPITLISKNNHILYYPNKIINI